MRVSSSPTHALPQSQVLLLRSTAALTSHAERKAQIATRCNSMAATLIASFVALVWTGDHHRHGPVAIAYHCSSDFGHCGLQTKGERAHALLDQCLPNMHTRNPRPLGDHFSILSHSRGRVIGHLISLTFPTYCIVLCIAGRLSLAPLLP